MLKLTSVFLDKKLNLYRDKASRWIYRSFKAQTDRNGNYLVFSTPIKLFISLPLFLLFCHTAIAMPDDREKVAQLSADTANLNQQTHTGEYMGDVQFDQGTTHLRAIKAITKGNSQNKLTYAVAFGNKQSPAHYWEQTSLEKPLLHAYAQEIRYYPERHLIELIGNALVTQGDNSFAAPKISYDTIKQHVLTSSVGKERTLIILHPEKKS